MTLTQLRYLIAIADSDLNITLAAERIHATQPGLSKQLKQLEDNLGLQLFARRGKRLDAITPAGQKVIARARVIVEQARNIRSLAAELRGAVNGELTLLTTHTQARFVLPTAVAAFRQRHPQVALHLRPHGDAQIRALFTGGQADMAIISSSGSAPLGGLAVPLYRWQRAVVAPHGHLLGALGRHLRLDELAQQPLVSYESSLRPESSLRRTFAAAVLTPRLACTTSDADLIKTYVRAGMGVGIVAEMALREADQSDLVVLDVGRLLPECTTWLVLHPQRVLRSYTLDLVARIAPHLEACNLRAALRGDAAPDWPLPPQWREVANAAGLPGRCAAAR